MKNALAEPGLASLASLARQARERARQFAGTPPAGCSRQNPAYAAAKDGPALLAEYLSLLDTPDAIAGPYLPPVPPPRLPQENRARAWAEWWDTVVHQRNRGIIGRPRPRTSHEDAKSA